jgi:Na+/melibiose symporter-like transporter
MPNPKTQATPTDGDRLKPGEYIGYALGDTASGFFFQTFNIFLTCYYVDVWGIPATVLLWLIPAVRAFGAFDDVIMGLVADRTTTRWGKFRPYLLFGYFKYVQGYDSTAVFSGLDRTTLFLTSGALGLVLGTMCLGPIARKIDKKYYAAALSLVTGLCFLSFFFVPKGMPTVGTPITNRRRQCNHARVFNVRRASLSDGRWPRFASIDCKMSRKRPSGTVAAQPSVARAEARFETFSIIHF